MSDYYILLDQNGTFDEMEKRFARLEFFFSMRRELSLFAEIKRNIRVLLHGRSGIVEGKLKLQRGKGLLCECSYLASGWLCTIMINGSNRIPSVPLERSCMWYVLMRCLEGKAIAATRKQENPFFRWFSSRLRRNDWHRYALMELPRLGTQQFRGIFAFLLGMREMKGI